MWGDLERELEKEVRSDPADGRRQQLEVLLNEAKGMRLREHRHDVVHSYWWIYAGVGLQAARWPRRSNHGYMQVGGSVYWLAELAEHTFAFAAKLDALVGDEWPVAVLPAS